ncbi:MAG TPA: hypothetical protein VHF01_16820 [Candidatus Acidoferrum sp.]|nr:hypothetical protein [Candidatus Acidoferrum sp.]
MAVTLSFQRPILRTFLCALCLPLLLISVCSHASAQERSADELHKLNESVNALIKKVSPSVVQILVTGYGPLEDSDRGSSRASVFQPSSSYTSKKAR